MNRAFYRLISPDSSWWMFPRQSSLIFWSRCCPSPPPSSLRSARFSIGMIPFLQVAFLLGSLSTHFTTLTSARNRLPSRRGSHWPLVPCSSSWCAARSARTFIVFMLRFRLFWPFSFPHLILFFPSSRLFFHLLPFVCSSVSHPSSHPEWSSSSLLVWRSLSTTRVLRTTETSSMLPRSVSISDSDCLPRDI